VNKVLVNRFEYNHQHHQQCEKRLRNEENDDGDDDGRSAFVKQFGSAFFFSFQFRYSCLRKRKPIGDFFWYKTGIIICLNDAVYATRRMGRTLSDGCSNGKEITLK
jgi:hypothetical protein